ncbi:BQ2448_6916 [Microbotryum intermedium]|uniref:Acyl-coenzyme A oxidase n=1 Tax=Microbotryum intermedium TaxID=269621 RepID=A0A238FLF5_9BASI|nr:BQ2448_6916 [Microbotryum intermedium]
MSQTTQDLTEARSRMTFDPTILNKVLNEGSRDSEMRARVAKIVSEDGAFDKSKKAYMSRSQCLERGLAVTRRLMDLVDEHDLDYMEYIEALACVDEPIGIYLHEVAFQPVIAAQCSDEQQAIWLPKCYNHEIIGCYLQTELGHGSNVQQLETTATYDPKTQEFILNSPTISSTKWWIGALGLLATHGVVQARLFIDGENYGPHLFLTQLRSLEDHSFMPGIQAGEIGPKVHQGMSAVDNGCECSVLFVHVYAVLKSYTIQIPGARFDHVRIPRDQMLNRFAKVSPEGKYSKPPHDKLSYGGMIFIRAQMIGNLAWKLAKAVTISTRYLHTRRQFADPELKRGEPGFGVERQVITYPGVYMRILPQLARSIVFITAGKDMSNLYSSMATQLAEGDTTLLAETHAVSSGLKTYVSAGTVDGIEIVRRAMGGHGFLDASGVGRIYASELPSVTYEGDNFILHLQVARAALKTYAAYQKNPSGTNLSPSSAYFSALGGNRQPSLPIQATSATWQSFETQLQVISLRAALQVDRLERLLRTGKKFGDLSHECIEVSKAVVEAFLVRRMIEAVTNTEEGLLNTGAGPNEKKVIAKVVHFFNLHTIEQALPSLLEFGILAPAPPLSASLDSPVEALRALVNAHAQALLPEAVGLVDAFNFSDWELDSTAGRYDGKAYEAMLERAKNDLDANVGDEEERKRMYREHIKPILERGKRLSKM